VLGLVSRHLNVHPFSKPCGLLVRGCASDAHYPINFVVKHPNLLVFFQEGPPWGGKNLPMVLACFQIGVIYEWQRSGNSE
jgi:hypothetical protein